MVILSVVDIWVGEKKSERQKAELKGVNITYHHES